MFCSALETSGMNRGVPRIKTSMRVPSLDRVTAVLAPLVTVIVTFLVIVVTLLVVRPPVPSSAQGVPPDAGARREVRIGAPGVPSVLDPGTALEGTVPLIARQVFDTLVVWREGSTEIDPALATRWTASRDGLVWSFTLREGVKFHDGTPLTSTEVAASFERQLQPETQSAGRAWPALLRGVPGVVKEFRTPSPRTVQIILSQPYSPLLTVLAHPGLAIAKLSTAADGTGRLVGTGPYRIVDASGGRLALEAISGHWAGHPRSERLVFLEVSTDGQAEAEMDSRSLDIWFPAGPPRRTEGALSTPGLRIGYLAFQTEKEPFSRKPLRQAVAAALDPAVLGVTLDRAAVPLQSFLPPGVWARREGSPILGGSRGRPTSAPVPALHERGRDEGPARDELFLLSKSAARRRADPGQPAVVSLGATAALPARPGSPRRGSTVAPDLRAPPLGGDAFRSEGAAPAPDRIPSARHRQPRPGRAA